MIQRGFTTVAGPQMTKKKSILTDARTLHLRMLPYGWWVDERTWKGGGDGEVLWRRNVLKKKKEWKAWGRWRSTKTWGWSGKEAMGLSCVVNTRRQGRWILFWKLKRIWENCDLIAIGNQVLVLKECGHLTWMEPLRFLSVCEYKDIHYQNSSINRASF